MLGTEPFEMVAVGTGFGSAWLRAGSSIGPVLVGWIVGDFGIQYVFAAFWAVALVGETKGRILGFSRNCHLDPRRSRPPPTIASAARPAHQLLTAVLLEAAQVEPIGARRAKAALADALDLGQRIVQGVTKAGRQWEFDTLLKFT
jgi:hypothetical protein